MIKIRMTKESEAGFPILFESLGYLKFEFVSDFDIRISNLF
jgi:hypothetical protein